MSQGKEIYKFQNFQYKNHQVKPKKIKYIIPEDDDDKSVSSNQSNQGATLKFDEKTGQYFKDDSKSKDGDKSQKKSSTQLQGKS